MIQNFIPAVWSAALLEALENTLVFGSPAVVNTNYEGEISGPGDTVHITSVSDVVVGNYGQDVEVALTGGDSVARHVANSIDWQVLTDSQKNLVINQLKYFAVALDRTEAKMAAGDLMGHITQRGAYNLANVLDQYLASLFAPQSANILAGISPGSASASGNLSAAQVGAQMVDEALVGLRKVLNKANVPMDGRYVVASPDVEAYFNNNSNFINAEKAADNGALLKNGQIGRARGFDILISNNCPAADGTHSTMVAGHPMAITFAQKTAELVTVDLENAFATGVKGLHVYGAKLIRPEAIAQVSVLY